VNEVNSFIKGYRLLEKGGKLSAPIILLLARLLIGIAFFNTGLGKLQNLEKTTSFFEELHIPMAKANAVMAGGTEMVGGILLAIGLCSRLISIPLAITMIVALLTAHKEATLNLYKDINEFAGQAPIPFLLVCLFVFAFGPGALSLDALIKYVKGKTKSSPDGERVKTAADAK
jgi:putative oxidoreductase